MLYTFMMIKPDATKRNLIGKINSYIESAGLEIVATKSMILLDKQAREFYEEHKERGFFNGLIEYMTSGMVVAQVVKGNSAVERCREIIGATNPDEAESGTIRGDFGVNIEENSIHASDSGRSATREVGFFFSKIEILN
jgi:nucleoside-diphosphate kinase